MAVFHGWSIKKWVLVLAHGHVTLPEGIEKNEKPWKSIVPSHGVVPHVFLLMQLAGRQPQPNDGCATFCTGCQPSRLLTKRVPCWKGRRNHLSIINLIEKRHVSIFHLCHRFSSFQYFLHVLDVPCSGGLQYMVFPDRLDVIPSVSMMPSKEVGNSRNRWTSQHDLIHSGHMPRLGNPPSKQQHLDDYFPVSSLQEGDVWIFFANRFPLPGAGSARDQARWTG